MLSARKWLEKTYGNFMKDPSKVLDSNNSIGVDGTVELGDMIMFLYDPKTKDKLPYYDTFPLVVPIRPYADGFLGVNLHYLPPDRRIVLLRLLMQTVKGKDDKRSMGVRWKTINVVCSGRYYKPTIKRYLYSHMRGKVIKVSPRYWQAVTLMPLSRFTKENKRRVWKDSKGKLR